MRNTMRKNQKGFTLVELIIAVAILAVVTLAVCGFIVVGSRSYTSANTDIMLQQDAQLALNQMSDVIIDTTESISYSGLVGGSMQTVLKDSEFSGEATDKCLAVVNKKPETGDLNQNPSYWFYYSKADETIYFNEVDLYDGIADPAAGPTESEIKDKFDAASTDKAVLAEHVTEFSVDVSQFEQNRVVMLALTFENGNRMYSTSNNVTVRNRIAINNITVGPMKRADEFVINAPDSITLEPGETYTFTGLKVNGEDAAAGSVTWSLLGEEKNGSFISPNGTVTVGVGETRKNFTVVATRAAFADSRSTKEVTVQVKRVTDVSLTCAQSTVKSGDTVTINATAVGNYLGVQCNGCPDSPAIDYDVTDWTTTNATKGDATARKLEITIASGLTDTDEVVIEATSLLSTKKVYDNVTGQLILKVEKGDEGEYPIQGDLKFGTDNDPGILDYMRSNLKTDWWRYVVCVRVREMDAKNALDDRVVMYYSTAANIRFFPDIYGLELNRSYKVFFQIIDPVSVDTRQKKANGQIGSYFEDTPQEIIDEYFAHIDSSTGKYTGKKYEWDGLYSGMLNQPTITVTYNGITYPNSLHDYYESVNLGSVGAGSGIINKFGLGDAINVDKNTILNDIEYVVYKDGTRLYGYDEASNSYTGERNYAGGLIYMEDRGSSMIMKRNSGSTPPAEAYGIYTVVPGFRYANSLDIRDYEYIYPVKNGALDTSKFFIPGKGGGDYSEHYYPQDWCKITVKVSTGLTLQLPSENGEERWASFPLPADKDFPFERGLTTEQTITRNLNVYTALGEYKSTLNNATITCKYIPADDAYEITLVTSESKPKADIVTKYGPYKCKVGQDSWTTLNAVPEVDEKSYWKSRIFFNYPYRGDIMMELPLPGESGFPTEAVNASEFVTNKQFWFVYDKYGEENWNNANFKFKYTKSGNTYTVTVSTDWGVECGTWTCSSTGDKWVKQ